MLDELGTLPTDARLATVDAVSMYSNIDTDHAIDSIEKWFIRHKRELPAGYPTNFVLKGIRLVMESNIFEFGDLSCLQKNGTAMGTSVACMYATIYFSYHEETRLCNPEVGHGIIFYCRFIDDVFLIQRQYPGSHARLVNDFNSFGPKGRSLEWLSSGPKTKVTFLDLSLTLVNGQVEASTYEKPLNLHLYIPAFSAHSPNMIRGLVFGMLRRFWLQNAHAEDYIRLTKAFFGYLIERGYSREQLRTLFVEAAQKLEEPVLPKCSNRDGTRNKVFLHVQFHPFQITGKAIQSVFRQECAEALRNAENPADDYDRLGIDRLIIAHSRAKNLRDKLCSSRLVLPEGRRVSEFVSSITKKVR
jgi:hypothetical protein